MDNHTLSKALEYELRIHDQFFYNFRNTWNTNLPYSKAPENENPIEEAAQKYTEVDMEQVAPSLIVRETYYFWDQQFDSEKSATSTRPDFYSELSWCNDSFTECVWDETGWMEKVVKQQ